MRTLIVVAHADDETLGAATAILSDPVETWILHCTDSAPANLDYARRAGFENRGDYAAARRHEFQDAMRIAGLPETHHFAMKIADQDAVRHIDEITAEVRRLHAEWFIERVLTHAYEGGHPDHDAVACAVQRAGLPNVWEMPLYHAHGGAFVTYAPLNQLGPGDATVIELDALQRVRKHAMLGSFLSQSEVLGRFSEEREVWRPMPVYDFGRPPHEGALYYDGRSLGIDSAEWRRLVAGLGSPRG